MIWPCCRTCRSFRCPMLPETMCHRPVLYVRTVVTMLRATNLQSTPPSDSGSIFPCASHYQALPGPQANTPITLQVTVAFALTALPGSDQVSRSPHGNDIPYPDCCRPKCTFILYSDTLCAKSLARYGHWSLCADISSRKSLWPSTLDGYPRVLSFYR